ncbi:retrovirus-related pol polyprotein from transposon TNT 1-94 [Tanacetum coccineum]
MDFVSSSSIINDVNTAYGVSTANTQVSSTSTQVSTTSTQVSTANLSDTVYAFLASQLNGSQLVYADLKQIHEDDIEEMDLKWQLALLSMRTKRFFQKTGRKITINGSDTAGYDKSKVECFNCHKMGHFARECKGPRNQDSRNMNQDNFRRTTNLEETPSKAMLAIDGASFDWSYMADDEVPTNMALMAFSDFEVHNDKTCSKTCLKSFETLKTQLDDLRIEFNKSEFNLATYKRGLASVEEQLVFYKKNESLDKLIGSVKYKSRKGVGFVSYNVVPPPPTGLFSPPNLDLSYFGLEEFQQHEFEGYGPQTSKSVSEDISNEVRESPDAPLVKELVSDDKLEKKTAFPTVAKIEFVKAKPQEKPVRKPVKYAEMYSFDHVQADCNYHQRERVVSGNNYTRVNYNYSAKKAHPSAHRNIVPRAVLMKTGLRPLNTARPVNTAHPKTTVYSARPMSHFSKLAQSTVKRPYQIRTALTNKNFSQKVNTAKGKFYTARPKAVNTARPNSAVVNAVRENQVNVVKASACWVWRPTKLNSASITLKRHNYEMHEQIQDETSGILKSFITEVENLVDKKVKIIRCDNGTEFKNRVMSEFYEKKGIKKEFSVARTPQQNGVAERRNRTLIEAARTMLADSKLPTTFWAEVVNIACYVQNRVLVVKPHNKTPYELFRGRTPALSFMRPFGCHVTILNTLDYLGKFDGKSDEGFFVGYSINSKAFRVYNIRTRKVEENLHIRFLEDKPIIAGTEESIGAGHSSKETRSSQDYILMPLWKGGSLFDSSLKNASNDEPQPFSDAGKKNDEGVCKESRIDDQERPKNSTQDVSTAGPSINIEPDMVSLGDNATLEATHADFFGDETESGVQIKTTNEQGFISAVYEGKTYEDLHTCLFACFLSQVEPKKVIQVLTDPSWIEAMQDELLQFKLHKVWTLVDLPYGKRAIRTKWVYMNKKDERGIVVRNKARLVAQGYTQEKGIDYDEVFAPVATIEEIRFFLAYASFMNFVVYQMDEKSAFLYGKIEEEVYVCQPPGFEDLEFPDRVYKVEKALYGLHQAPRAESIDQTPLSDSITPDLPIAGSLTMEDEHLDTILEMDLDEEIESSVENLNLTPSESEDLSDYIFSTPLFDSNDDYTSSDDESSSEEDVLVENFKIYSNPLLEFDEEIFSSETNPLYNKVLEDFDSIPPGNENDHFNVESDLIESFLNKDTVITSPNIDFLLEEFVGELALINLIPPGIAETNFDPKEAIRLIKKLLYDNSSPHPPEELNSENDFEKDNSGSTTIHTDIYLLEYESFDDESDSAFKIFNDDLAHVISPSDYEYVYADDGSDSGDLTTDVVEDILGDSTRKLQMSHRGFKALKISHSIGYQQKEKNKAKTRQNRARDWKEHGKLKPKASAS